MFHLANPVFSLNCCPIPAVVKVRQHENTAKIHFPPSRMGRSIASAVRPFISDLLQPRKTNPSVDCTHKTEQAMRTSVMVFLRKICVVIRSMRGFSGHLLWSCVARRLDFLLLRSSRFAVALPLLARCLSSSWHEPPAQLLQWSFRSSRKQWRIV
jgi:hypothetical protein